VYILLIRPPYRDLYQLIKGKTKEVHIVPPLGLLYVAGALEKAGHRVEILDGEVEQIPMAEVAKEAVSRKPDLIGTGATSVDFHLAEKFAREVKGQTDIPIVLGGPHATVMPEEVLAKSPWFDFLVRGEGEETVVELAELLTSRPGEGETGSKQFGLEKISGLSYRKNGQAVHNADRSLSHFGEGHPWPARHLLKLENYKFPVPRKGMRPMSVMQAARGCPYGCLYCYKMFGTRTRQRPVEDVLNELEHVVRELGCEWVTFVDDTFTLNPQRVIELCEGILERKLRFNWLCLARADTVSRPMVQAMKAAGCTMISIGVESGNDEILKAVGKGESREDFRQAFAVLREAGLEARGSFILGLPGETVETLRASIRFAQELDMDRAFFNVATPYPRTRLWDLADQGAGMRFTTRDFGAFTRWGNAVIELPGLSATDLKHFQRQAMAAFYCQPRVIARHLKEYLQGDHAQYYYRPLLFGLRERLRMVLR
jgi:anaerobic magnesium-protoporphyrin IX monomethyl ester cyclase